MEHEYESTPRDCSRDAPSVFRPIKISGLSVKATLRWMRNAPGSFRDFPAPRSAAHSRHGWSEVLASTNHPIRFSPVVGAMCHPPMSKINFVSNLHRKRRILSHIPAPDASKKFIKRRGATRERLGANPRDTRKLHLERITNFTPSQV